MPADLREKLAAEYEDEPVKIIKTLTASDGTEKYLFSLADGNIVEGVLMKYEYGYSQCVSTQVGCRMGCKFCASTLGGLVRNLTAGEIIAQILTVNALHAVNRGGSAAARAVNKVVLMGSGEPLDNYCNVIKFLRNVTAAGGINISARNISLSTCGIVPKIYALADEGIDVNLSISLHQTTDEGRARTMPVAKKYSIAEMPKSFEVTMEFAEAGPKSKQLAVTMTAAAETLETPTAIKSGYTVSINKTPRPTADGIKMLMNWPTR